MSCHKECTCEKQTDMTKTKCSDHSMREHKYESSIYTCSEVIDKVKALVHAHPNVRIDAGDTTIALWTFVPAS